jgi:integrase
MARAGLDDLRLHDLRHEAVSRFFELGLTIPEVALISGHRDPRMLSRYTHLRPENIAEKLAKLTASQA